MPRSDGWHPRIVVAGAGNVGGYVGGCLALAGRDVTLLLRKPLHDAIARHGLRVSDLGGADRHLMSSAVKLTTDPEIAFEAAEVILVTVKSGATANVADEITRYSAPDAVVLSFQNGIGNVAALRARLDTTHPVIAGMVPFNVVQKSEAGNCPHFHRATSGTSLIAPDRDGLLEVLNVAGAPVAEHRNMKGVLWAKLLLNLNNALNALSGLPLAVELADRRWRRLLATQIDEALTVLTAAGIRPAGIEGVDARLIPFALRLPDPVFRLVGNRMLAVDAEARSSMWEDLERGRPTEIDFLQGAVLELARTLRLAAPLTERISRLVKAAERAGRGSPRMSPDDVQAAVEPGRPI